MSAEISTQFDDLRADMNARFAAILTDMNGRFTAIDKRIDDLRSDMNRGFKTLTWMIGVWSSFLTLLIVLFEFAL